MEASNFHTNKHCWSQTSAALTSDFPWNEPKHLTRRLRTPLWPSTSCLHSPHISSLRLSWLCSSFDIVLEKTHSQSLHQQSKLKKGATDDGRRQTDDKIKDRRMRGHLEGEGRGNAGHCLFIMAHERLQLLGSNREGLMETPLPALCCRPHESGLGG